MKVTCQTCGAKYTVSDDKVQGKTVKIRCKKCGTSIVVGDEGGHGAAAHEAPAAAPSGLWNVMVAEGDQRSLSEAEVREFFRAGHIDDQTYVWREGMADWAPLADAPDLRAVVHQMDEDQPTRMGTVPAEIMAMGRKQISDAPPPGPAPRADIFGGGAPKPIEEDQATTMFNSAATAASPFASSSAPAARRPAAGAPAPRPMFQEPAPAPLPVPTASPSGPKPISDADASGMIDIRMLQASRQPPPKPRRDDKVDDLFGAQSGPALFDAPAPAPMMMSLDLNAPSPPEPPPPAPPPPSAPYPGVQAGYPAQAMPAGAPFPAPQKKSSAGLIIGLVVGGLLLLVGGAAAAVVFTKKDPPRDEKTAKADEGKAADGASAPATTGDAPRTPDAPPSGTPPTATTAAPDTTATTADPKKPKTAAELKKEQEEKKKKEEEEKKKKAEDDKKKAEEEKKKAAPAEPDPPAGGDGPPFDRAAALSALSGAAGAAQSCKTADGPTGNGRASVTFAPSGRVTQAVIEGAFAGTSVGSCIAAKFRGAKVPAFGGSPVTVKKSFSVN